MHLSFRRTGDAPSYGVPGLVPQLDVVLGRCVVSALQLGAHVRAQLLASSSLGAETEAAVEALRLYGNAAPLARLVPTVVAFDAWTEQGRPVPPRIVRAVVAQKPNETHLTRDVTINLDAVRRLRGEGDDEAVRRYVLGLALVGAFAPYASLVRGGARFDAMSARWHAVGRGGRLVPVEVEWTDAFAYARDAAERFGVGPDRRAVLGAAPRTRNTRAARAGSG